MKNSFSKRAVAVILTVMMVFSMVPMMAFSASAEITGTISNGSEFRTALNDGGTYELTKDISVAATDGFNVVKKDTTIIGNGYSIKRGTPGNTSLVTVNEGVTFNVENATFDGKGTCVIAITAITLKGKVDYNGPTINLTGCTVKNFNADAGSRAYGAVYYFNNSKGTLKNCTFENNKGWGTKDSGGDVWAGAATNVTIDGGTYSEIFANGSEEGPKSEITLTGGATVEKANCIVSESIVPVNATVTDVVVNGINANHNVAIGAAGYDTLEEALAAAKDGDVITCSNPEYQVTAAVKTAKNVTLDGFTFNMTSKVRNPLVMTGSDVAVKNCTFKGIIYNAIETTQSKTAPLNSLTVEGCTFESNAENNNHINCFSFTEGATVKITNNTFNCKSGSEAIRISNYTNAENVTYTIDNNIYNAQGSGEYDTFIMFQAVNGEKFDKVDVNITNLENTNNRPVYFVYENKKGNTTVSEKTEITLDNTVVDYRKNVTIGTKGYDTLEEALAAANNGDVITCSKPEYQVTAAVKTAKNVTLDGFTFNMTSNVRNPLVMTGSNVAVKNCTFKGIFYNAIETTQSKTAPLNSLTVEGCTFEAGKNNSVNVFSFVDGAQVNISNNTFNCGDDCEAIRISNYTNAQNVKFTVDNNTYAPKNGDVATQWDAFILFQDTTADNTTDFTGINVAVTNLNTTSANPLYAVCDKPCNDTTATVETMVTKDDTRVDLREVQAQVVLADGMVGIKVVGENVTIDGTAVENGTLYLTPAEAADFDKEYAVVADGVTGTFTMNDYINALTDENAKAALQAFEVYAKAAANKFSGGSYEVTTSYNFDSVDAKPVKDDIYCGVSIDCSSKTQLIVYADGVAAGTAVKVNGADTSIVTVDCGSNSHTAIVVPVNSINTPVTIEVDGKSITYSVKQASGLLSGVSGYETLAAALANYGDALAAYTA